MAHSVDTGGAPDPEQLHDLAGEAVQCVSKLGTGLAAAGAPENVTATLDKMAEALGQIQSGLAKGMKAAPAEPPHTIASETDAMMADRAAARQAQDAAPIQQ